MLPPFQLSLMAAMPTAVHTGRCLWQRHQGAACKFCLEACPTAALHFGQRAVILERERCLGCGACLTTCPTECFESEDWSERSLASTVKRLQRPAVEVACKWHPAPAAGVEAVHVVQVDACLAAISPGLWFELGLETAVTVRLERCAGCPMGAAARYTRRAIELAQSWLQAGGVEAEALTIQEAPADPHEALKRMVISAERPVLNRRDFLFRFARSSGPAGLALEGLPAAPFGAKEGQASAPYQPAWLRRMAALYPQARSQAEAPEQPAADQPGPSPETTPAYGANWPTLGVANNCVACGACARYCPSGALRTKQQDGQYRHLFTPGYCIACGLCAQVCSTGALTRSYTPEPAPFDDRVMAERPVSSCRKCGSPALKLLDGLCYWCTTEPPVTSLLDSARKNLLRG